MQPAPGAELHARSAVERRLLWVFPGFADGGAQRRCIALLPRLRERYEHHLIALDGCLDALPACTVPITTHSVTVRKSRGMSPGNVWRFAHILLRLRPHRLITHNWGCIEWHFAGRLTGTTHLHIEDGFGSDESAATLPRRDRFRRIAFRGARKAFIAPSQTLATLYTRTWGVPPERLHAIANGIDLQAFTPTPRLHVAPPLTVVTVAVLRPEKRIDRLLRIAAAQVVPLRLLIVGDGPEMPALQALAKDLKLNVEWAGAQSDVRPFLQRSDVFALTSDTEQLPLSLLEAMAFGLPALACAVGDVPRLLPEQTAAPGDEAGLARLLAELLQDPALRARLSVENRERVECGYSLDAMAIAYEALLR